jgi:hypothetical protein
MHRWTLARRNISSSQLSGFCSSVHTISREKIAAEEMIDGSILIDEEPDSRSV